MKKKILLIFTGGTMGMKALEEEKGINSDKFIGEIFHYIPEVKKIAQIELEVPFTLDSTDVGIPEWQRLGELLAQNIDRYDGFVIIHGTDTMSFTACALSYMMVNLPRPVILTGSQRPLASIRTDARSNLINAIELATYPIPEVGLLFSNQLFRGNRTKKISIDGFDAFASPNFPLLAKVGRKIEMITPPRRPNGIFRIETGFDPRVACIHLFPSIQLSFWEEILKSDIQIVILEAFGAGNIPSYNKNLLEFISEFTSSGRLVVIGSQAPEGTCDLSLYPNGRIAQKAGAISARDMTLEATIVKAMFLLALFKGDIPRIRKNFHFSIAGEISESTAIL